MYEFFDKLSASLRKVYYTRNWRVITGVVLGALVSLTVAVILDMFTPFSGVWMVARSATLYVIASTVFSLVYMMSFPVNDWLVRKREWVSLRHFYSLNGRRRIALIVSAFIILMIYATGYTPLYTVLSSFYGVLLLCLVMFIRPTKQEHRNENLGVPDMRDVTFKRRLSEKGSKNDAEKD